MGTPIWCDEGENRVLNILLGDSPVDGALYLGLYKNVVQPDETARVADLVEPSGFGYARKPLSRGLANWTISRIRGSSLASTSAMYRLRWRL